MKCVPPFSPKTLREEGEEIEDLFEEDKQNSDEGMKEKEEKDKEEEDFGMAP